MGCAHSLHGYGGIGHHADVRENWDGELELVKKMDRCPREVHDVMSLKISDDTVIVSALMNGDDFIDVPNAK